VLIRLPTAGPTEDELVALAAAEGLALEGLGQHWHGKHSDRQGLIIGFCRPSERAYPAAVALLARVLHRALQS
jgi:GntR family transcriptional regulator/MocR family aminotransferase